MRSPETPAASCFRWPVTGTGSGARISTAARCCLPDGTLRTQERIAVMNAITAMQIFRVNE
jgi:hypothetical protein